MPRWAFMGWMLLAAGTPPVTARPDKAETRPHDGREPLLHKLPVLAEVLAQIQMHYVDPVAPADLIYEAAQGAVQSLDGHSEFYPPEAYRSLLDATEGEFAGLGLEVETAERLPEVVTVLSPSPAAAAGLGPHDLLLSIDGLALDDLEFDAVSRLLRGAVGSSVTLVVQHPNAVAPKTYVLQRDWLRVEPLERRELGDVTYVRLKAFSRQVAGRLGAALAERPPSRGLVLDLRGNPGGLFDEAVQISDLFLTTGTIVTTVGRDGERLEQPQAHAEGTQPAYRMAVLIDHDSASAAEIVAGALHDCGRARLFGARSYGKGSVQNIVDLSDGSGLKLTVARYYTPAGTAIDRAGIEPDEVIAPQPGPGSAPTYDRVLAAAVDFMRQP